MYPIAEVAVRSGRVHISYDAGDELGRVTGVWSPSPSPELLAVVGAVGGIAALLAPDLIPLFDAITGRIATPDLARED